MSPHLLIHKSLLVRLAGLGLPRAFGPSRLLVSEDEEEADGVDTEEILTKLAGEDWHACYMLYTSVLHLHIQKLEL